VPGEPITQEPCDLVWFVAADVGRHVLWS